MKSSGSESATTPNRRQLQSAERRRRILAAANKAFGTNGFRKTSVDMIAEAAGVSKGLVFAFFEHKDGLYDAVIEQTLVTWTGFAEHQAAQYPDRAELELASMFRGSFEFATHSPMLRVLMAKQDRAIQERLQSLPRIARDWRGRFANILQRGITGGVFRSDLDPFLTSRIIHDIQSLYLEEMIQNDGNEYDPKRMEAALQLILQGLLDPAFRAGDQENSG